MSHSIASTNNNQQQQVSPLPSPFVSPMTQLHNLDHPSNNRSSHQPQLPQVLAAAGGAMPHLAEQGEQNGEQDPGALSWALTLTSRIPFDEDGKMTSIGSIFHHQGGCRPCRFHHHPGKPEGCQYGVGCLFCHFHHDRRRRRALNDNRGGCNSKGVVPPRGGAPMQHTSSVKAAGAGSFEDMANRCGSHHDLRIPSYPGTPPPPPSTPTTYSPPHLRRTQHESPPPTPNSFPTASYRQPAPPSHPPPHHFRHAPSRSASGPIPPPPSSPQSVHTFIPSATNSTQLHIPSPPAPIAQHFPTTPPFNRDLDDQRKFFAPIEPAALDSNRAAAVNTFQPLQMTRAQQLHAAFYPTPTTPRTPPSNFTLADTNGAIPEWYHFPTSLDNNRARCDTDSPRGRQSLSTASNGSAMTPRVISPTNGVSEHSGLSPQQQNTLRQQLAAVAPSGVAAISGQGSRLSVGSPMSPPPGILKSVASVSGSLLNQASVDSMGCTPSSRLAPGSKFGEDTPSTCYTSAKSVYDDMVGGFTPSPTGSDSAAKQAELCNVLPPVSLPPLSTEVAEALLKTSGATGGDAQLLRALLAPLFSSGAATGLLGGDNESQTPTDTFDVHGSDLLFGPATPVHSHVGGRRPSTTSSRSGETTTASYDCVVSRLQMSR